jgi:hypothetical protein
VHNKQIAIQLIIGSLVALVLAWGMFGFGLTTDANTRYFVKPVLLLAVLGIVGVIAGIVILCRGNRTKGWRYRPDR